MENRLLDIEGIKTLFENNKKQTLECIKADWSFGLTAGEKYIVEMSDGEFITFVNDNGDNLSLKLKNATKHFATIISSRKRKLSDIIKRIPKDEV